MTVSTTPASGLPAQFIQERVYLKSVTPSTVGWYRLPFRVFDGAMNSREAIVARIGLLRDRGVSPIGVNSYLRVINAFHKWCSDEGTDPHPLYECRS
jgi:hypothetical protein